MSYKNKEDQIKYDKEYYLKVKKPNYIPHPRVKKTREEKLADKRAWYYANPEKVKEMSKRSREKHKEQRKLDNKIWVENNKEWIKKYHKRYGEKYYQENKEEINIRSKKWAKDNPDKWQDMVRKSKIFHREDIVEREKRYRKTLQGKYKSLRNSAKQRNYKLELSFKQFCEVIDNPCVYCGETEERIGVDRIDNSVGYTLENSAPCCKICNFMKRAMSVDDFLNHIKKIYLHK